MGFESVRPQPVSLPFSALFVLMTEMQFLSFLLLLPCFPTTVDSYLSVSTTLPSEAYQSDRNVNVTGRELEAAPVLLAFVLS